MILSVEGINLIILNILIAIDLLKKMLEPDPKLRITAKLALKHPWFET